MNKEDKRVEDLGPEGRRLDLKTLVVVFGLLANVGTVIWKGGEITARFDSFLEWQRSMNARMESVQLEQNTFGRQISVTQEVVKNHEVRLNRIEDRNVRTQ